MCKEYDKDGREIEQDGFVTVIPKLYKTKPKPKDD